MAPEIPNETTTVAVMANDIGYIKKAIEKIDERLDVMDSHYIRRDEVMDLEKSNKKAHEALDFQLREHSLKMGTYNTYFMAIGIVIAASWAVLLLFISKHI
jgi:hypothetical protein